MRPRIPAVQPSPRSRWGLHATRRATPETSRTHDESGSRNIDSGQARGWASGKTVNVTRRGPLLREERTLADGTVLVRYQYGNGPAHFEKRRSEEHTSELQSRPHIVCR